MKTKFLLIAIGSTMLFLTSCEKDEMGAGGTGGGGKENANTYTYGHIKHNTEPSDPDSLLYKSNIESSLVFE